MKQQNKEEQTPQATAQPRKSNIIYIVLATFMIFFGCCTNVIALELILHKDPQAGGIVTLIQFLVIAIEGFISQVTFKNGSLFSKKKLMFRIWIQKTCHSNLVSFDTRYCILHFVHYQQLCFWFSNFHATTFHF